MNLTPELVQERLLSGCRHQLEPAPLLAIEGVTRISDGWETDVWAFTAVHDGGTQGLILRIYPGAGVQAKAAGEFRVMQGLYAAGYPVPRVLFFESDPALFGGPFLVMERIDGPVMGPVVWQAPPDQRQRLITRFVQLQADLHRLDWRPFVPGLPALPLTDPQTYTREHLNHTAAFLTGLGKAEMFAPALAWLEERSRTVPCRRLSLLHMDFHMYNVLLRNGLHPVVIDWSGAEVGDPRLDLAWTAVLTYSYGRTEMREVILQEYESVTGEAVADFDYFDALALGRRLFSLAISLSDGAAALGMRPGLEEQLRANIGYARHVYALLQQRTGLRLPEVERVLGL